MSVLNPAGNPLVDPSAASDAQGESTDSRKIDRVTCALRLLTIKDSALEERYGMKMRELKVEIFADNLGSITIEGSEKYAMRLTTSDMLEGSEGFVFDYQSAVEIARAILDCLVDDSSTLVAQ